MIRRELRRVLDLAFDAHDRSLCPRVRRPAGTSWFAARIAFITWSTPMPSAVTALGLIWIEDLPRHPAEDVDARDARARSRAP